MSSFHPALTDLYKKQCTVYRTLNLSLEADLRLRNLLSDLTDISHSLSTQAGGKLSQNSFVNSYLSRCTGHIYSGLQSQLTK